MEKNDNILCINYTIKTGISSGNRIAKPVKAASFFIQDRLFFVKNSLQKPLEICVPPQRPGWRERECGPGSARGLCGGCGDVYPAVLDAFLCPVFASFPAKKVVLYLNASVLSMVII
ncbi:MAG: hypothetical protein ACLRS8_18180 [Parabacteroides merdae]